MKYENYELIFPYHTLVQQYDVKVLKLISHPLSYMLKSYLLKDNTLSFLNFESARLLHI